MYNEEYTKELAEAIKAGLLKIKDRVRESEAEREALKKEISQKETHLAETKGALGNLRRDTHVLDQIRISDFERLRKKRDISELISGAGALAACRDLMTCRKEKLEQSHRQLSAKIACVERQPDYQRWYQIYTQDASVYKNSYQEPGPQDLFQYDSEKISEIISQGTGFWNRMSQKNCAAALKLYDLYQNALERRRELEKEIRGAEEKLGQCGALMEQWAKRLKKEQKDTESAIVRLKERHFSVYSEFPEQMKKFLSAMKKELVAAYPINDCYMDVYTLEKNTVNWLDRSSYDGWRREENDSFLLDYKYGIVMEDIRSDHFTETMARELAGLYPLLLSISGKTLFFQLPVVLRLNSRSFQFVAEASRDYERLYGNIQYLVGKIAANLPAGRVELVFFDPKTTGVFSVFNDLGKGAYQDFASISCLYEKREIEAKLDSVKSRIGNTIQTILKGPETTLYQHNKKTAFHSTPYIFLFFLNFPADMTAGSLQALRNIIANGARCGVFPFIFSEKGEAYDFLNQNEQRLVDGITKNKYVLEGERLYDGERLWMCVRSMPEEQKIKEFIEGYNGVCARTSQVRISIDELQGETCQNGNYRIPVGKNIGGETEYISFSDSCQNYLMTGATNKGKSNAFHVIINSTLKYVPDAELYLVDLKEGVEFDSYARLNHPALKVLALGKIPVYGLLVLRHIERKMRAISRLYTGHNVKNWEEYYKKTGKTIPVTLVMIDEFQHLFAEEQREECNRIMNYIVTNGRAFHVHMILATQSISNAGELSPGTKENMYGRMVFYSAEEKDYRDMLWNNTDLARGLKNNLSGQMVLSAGNKSQQRLIQWAEAKPVQEVIKEFSHPVEEGRYALKLLTNNMETNCFSAFASVIRGEDQPGDEKACELYIGCDGNLDFGNLEEILSERKPVYLTGGQERSFLRLKDGRNENLICVGEEERIAEEIFQMSVFSVLICQVRRRRKGSIAVIAPERLYWLREIADAFSDYMDLYGEEDELGEHISLEKTEFLLIFGLHYFSSMSLNRSYADKNKDSEMLEKAMLSPGTKVIAWHRSVKEWENFFLVKAPGKKYTDLFGHRIGFHMEAEEAAKRFLGGDDCFLLDREAVFYKKANRKMIVWPYHFLSATYRSRLMDAIRTMDKEEKDVQ